VIPDALPKLTLTPGFLVLAMNSFSLFPVFRRQTPVLCEKLTRALLIPLLIGDFTQ
jgi:hypothetical protein